MTKRQAQAMCPVQGTAQLHQSLLAKLELQLQNFEQYAWETCLHIPAGLMPAEVGIASCDNAAPLRLMPWQIFVLRS